MFKLLNGLIDRAFAVLGAFFFSQFPFFMNQYQQRLAGHVSELAIQIEKIRQTALTSQKTLEQYIQKFLQSHDNDFIRQGEFMQDVLARWQELNKGLVSLDLAVIWERPFVFLKYINIQIAKDTFKSFVPGIALNYEGAIYALIGIGIGYSSFSLTSYLFQTLFHTFFKQKKSGQAQ